MFISNNLLYFQKNKGAVTMALINVAKARVLCPVCNKPDWCMISEDGKLALCQRIANDHPNKRGGWWHSLSSDPIQKVEKRKRKEKATLIQLDLIYRAVLKVFPLLEEHRDKLLNRGLTKEEIYLHGYRSLPVERYNGIKMLENYFKKDVFAQVPGFCKRKGKNGGSYWWIQGGSGILIPVISLDEHNLRRVAGLQVRLDDPTRNTKYLNLSTDGYEGGTSCGILTHVALPEKINTNDIWITEGTIKANVLMTRLQASAIGLSGVAGWHDVIDMIKKIHHKHKIHEGNIIIAFDADYEEKEQVFQHMAQMYKALEEEFNQDNFPIYFATWNINEGKGIDDFIMSGGFPLFVDIDEIQRKNGFKHL